MKVRQAVMGDAPEISEFLEQLTSLGKRNIPSDPNFVRTQYVTHPDKVVSQSFRQPQTTVLLDILIQ